MLLAVRKMAPGFRARRFSRNALAQRPYFPDLLTVFSIHCRAMNCWQEALRDWEERLQPVEGRTPQRKGGGGRPEGGTRKPRRRGGGGRRRPAGSGASGTRS